MSKKKLQLTVQDDLIKDAKYIALKHDRSISQLLEDYIKAIKQNPELIDLIIQYSNNTKSHHKSHKRK